MQKYVRDVLAPGKGIGVTGKTAADYFILPIDNGAVLVEGGAGAGYWIREGRGGGMPSTRDIVNWIIDKHLAVRGQEKMRITKRGGRRANRGRPGRPFKADLERTAFAMAVSIKKNKYPRDFIAEAIAKANMARDVSLSPANNPDVYIKFIRDGVVEKNLSRTLLGRV
jgi:hypothetical protein